MASSTEANRRRRWPRWVLGLLVSTLVVRMVLPWIAVNVIERVGGGLLGRGVAVTDVELGVLAGRLQVLGLRIGGPLGREPAEGEEPVVVVDELLVDVGWLRLLQLELVADRLWVDHPRVRVSRTAEGWPDPLVLPENRPPWIRPWVERSNRWVRRLRWAFAAENVEVRAAEATFATDHGPIRGALRAEVESIAAAPIVFEAGRVEVGAAGIEEATVGLEVTGSGPEPEPVPPPPSYPSVELAREVLAIEGDRVGELSLRGVRFRLEREGRSVEGTVGGRVRDIAVAPGHTLAVETAVTLGEGSVAVEGDLTPVPPTYAGGLRWEGLDLAELAAFAGLDLPVDLEHGASDGDMRAELAADVDAARIRFELSGWADVSEIRVRGETDSFDAHVASARVAARRLAGTVDAAVPELGPLVADFEKIQVERPRARVDVPVLNLAQIDIADWIPDDIEELLAEAEMDVGELRVVDATVDAHDTSVAPPMRTELTDVDVEIRTLRWPELDAERIHVAASEAHGGGLDLVGSLDGGVGTLSGVVSRMPLTSFSGYAVEISGFQIVEGATSLDSSVAIDGDNARLTGNLTLHRLDIDAAEGLFASVFGPPLEVGLALLSNDNDDMGVPVVLDYEYGTDLSIWQIVWASLKAALQGGIATALGGVAGPDGVIEPVSFEAGMAKAEAGDRLRNLADALRRHPTLAVAFVGHAGPADRERLAGAGASDLEALALRRATLLRDRLLSDHGVDPTRVVARAGDPAEPSVTVELSLEQDEP